MDLESAYTLSYLTAFAMLFSIAIGWRKFRQVRFSLLELVASVVGYGAVMTCLQFLINRMGWEKNVLMPIAVISGLLFVQGLVLGDQNRKKIHEHMLSIRTLVYLTGLLCPACVIPALVTTVGMARNLSVFRNDPGSTLAWLFLLAPCLSQLWFSSIDSVRKDDKPQ